MPKRTIIIESFPVSDGRILEMSVSYSVGGPNFLSGGVSPRGYAINACLVKIEDHGTYTSRVIQVGDGTNVGVHIEAAVRFNPRRLEQLAVTAKHHELFAKVREYVLTKGKVTIVTPQPAVSPPARAELEPISSIDPDTGDTAQPPLSDACPSAGASPAPAAAGQLSLFAA